MIVQRFNLNLIPNQSPVVVHVNQYDTGTGRLIATLYEGNEPYSPSGTAVIQGTKPDGHGFQYTATLDGNVVTADLTEQMAPVAGDVRAQIVVTESSGVTGTFAFIIRVQPSALPSDTDMSESDYQYIEEAIREAQEAVHTAQEATETAQEAVERAQEAITETQENAENSEAWAQGTRGGIPVEPTDPTYEHNAEYWAQYAERYAQGGLHYKASILFANIPTTGMREGDMYDITDDFTTDSRFTEGAGIKVKGGTNIAWNSDNKWDILALPYIPKTTFNGRSGSILPMAGDYDSKKILLSSALHIGGETQNDVQEALEALSNDGVKSFNGRSGSVLPIAGDYDSEKILLASVLHIGGETRENVQEALEALESNKADKVDNAIVDNFAGLDANGNLKDSGKNAGDFATPSDIAGQQSLLKDTVGWTGKNYWNENELTFSVNGSTATITKTGGVTNIQVTGKNGAYGGGFIASTKLRNFFANIAGKKCILSFDIKSDTAFTGVIGSVNKYGVNVTTEWKNIEQIIEDTASFPEFNIYAGGNDLPLVSIKNLMLRDASITDDTYEPYHESVEVMYEEEIHGVNLIPFPYSDNGSGSLHYGITYTVRSDGSVVANGTATGNSTFWLYGNGWNYNSAREHSLKEGESYIISDGTNSEAQGNAPRVCMYGYKPDGTGWKGSEISSLDNLPFVVNSTIRESRIVIYIRIPTGTTVNNLVFKPMLRKADIDDPTYRPYNHQAIQNQLNAQGVLGAKNLFKLNNVGRTVNGVTFTLNDDNSFTANGTATADTYFESHIMSAKANDVYIVSDNLANPSDSTYRGKVMGKTTGIDYAFLITGKEKKFTVTNTENIVYSFKVKSGQTVNNITFKPMLRLASDPDDTYQPYAMTNRELTEYNKGFNFLKFLFNADGSDIYSGNLNDLHAGYAYYSNAAVNIPSNYYGYCITLERPSSYNYAVQIAINATGDSVNMYVRKKASNTWGAWKTVTMS